MQAQGTRSNTVRGNGRADRNGPMPGTGGAPATGMGRRGRPRSRPTAILRALFAFSQSFNAERVSQSIAYDFRSDLFAKISRLSFSYHDKNQTGQLMVRATDDVEKVRLFIGQGLLLNLQAFVLLIGSLIILWFTNQALTLVVLPILPVALALFMVFGRIAQPLFREVQQRVSRLTTILQENVAGLK